jgi:hypothetical protein
MRKRREREEGKPRGGMRKKREGEEGKPRGGKQGGGVRRNKQAAVGVLMKAARKEHDAEARRNREQEEE